MTTYIRMPWDEPDAFRWTSKELVEALRLRDCGLDYAQIADRLAEAGHPARDDTAVAHKMREYDRSCRRRQSASAA